MKIFKRYKLSAVLAACLGTFMLAATAQAGQIDADLWQAMQNGGDVDFIVRFNDQLDLSRFPGNAKGKGMQRSALLWALRDQADVSQSDAFRLLRASGAKRLIQLWSINALAVPNTAKVGSLRNSNAPQIGRTYWMFFGNHNRIVQKGDQVTVAIGNFQIKDLMLQ